MNKDLFDWYKKIFHFRKQYKSLSLGDYTTITTDDANKVYAFKRKLGNEEVIVIINRGDEPASFNHDILESGKFRNVFTKALATNVMVGPMDLVVLSNNQDSQD